MTVSFPVSKSVSRSVSRAVTDIHGSSAVSYSLQVEFATDDAAPITSPYAGEVGELTAREVDGTFGVATSKLTATKQTTPAWNDQDLYSATGITRSVGVVFTWEMTPSTVTANERCQWGWWTNTALTASDSNHAITLNSATGGNISGNSSALKFGTYAISTSYQMALVLRATGQFVLIKGGTFTDWTLLWIETAGSTATLYPGLSSNSFSCTSDYWRVTSAAFYTPALTFQDGFTDTNSVSLHSHTPTSDAVEESTGASGTWTEQSGDWDIQSNAANNVGAAESIATLAASSADVVALATVTPASGGVVGILFRYADTSNYWRLVVDETANLVVLTEVVTGTPSTKASVATTITAGVAYELQLTADGADLASFADGVIKATTSTATNHQTETIHGIYSNAVAGNKVNSLAIMPRNPSDVPAAL